MRKASPDIHIIYLAKNLANGKVYVGKTRHALSRRRSQHLHAAKKDFPRSYFHKAIKAYGAENFEFSVIDTAETFDESNAKEMLHIKMLNSQNPTTGYNMTAGGEGVDPETSRMETLRRVENGTHPCIGEAGSLLQKKCMELGTNIMGKVIECPHCGKVGKGTVMFRYHMDACIKNESVTEMQMQKRKADGQRASVWRSKLWEVLTPDGVTVVIRNLRAFCISKGLHTSAMSLVAAGRQRSHKGYICKIIEGDCYA